MTPEQEQEWLEKLNVYERQVVESHKNDWGGLGREEENFNGQKVIVFTGMTGNYCFYEDMSLDLIEEDQDLDEEELGEKYNCEFYIGEFWFSAENKLPDGVIYTDVDC